MAVGRLFLPGWMPARDSDGDPIPNVSVTFYENETDVLATVYADEGLTTPLANPLYANSSGRFPQIYASDTMTYSASVDAPYGPAGQPFTFDDLQASESANIAAANLAQGAAEDAEQAYQDTLAALAAAQAVGGGTAAAAGALAGQAAANLVVAGKADNAFTHSVNYPASTLSDKADQSISLRDLPYGVTGVGTETAKVQAALNATKGQPIYSAFNVLTGDVTAPYSVRWEGPGQLVKSDGFGNTILAYHGIPKAPRSWGRANFLSRMYVRANDPGSTLTGLIVGDSRRAPVQGYMTASISGTTLTVTAIAQPTGNHAYDNDNKLIPATIARGAGIVGVDGTTVAAGTKVTGYIAGGAGGYGGVGTYTVNISQTVASGKMQSYSGGGFTDFTPAGYIGTAAEPQEIWERGLRERGFENAQINIRNHAIGGTGWDALDLVAEFNKQPFDFVEICIGTNNANEPVEVLIAGLRSKIKALRDLPSASGTVSNIAIVLTIPPTAFDPPSGRDGKWFSQLVDPLFAMAEEFDCAVHNAYDLCPVVYWMPQATGGLMTESLYTANPVAYPDPRQWVHGRIGFMDMEYADKFNELMPPGTFNSFFDDRWQPAVGANSWVPGNGGIALMPLRFRRSKNGDIDIIGCIQGGTPTNDQTMTAFNYRMAPSTNVPFIAMTSSGTCRMLLQTDGTIRQLDANASTTWTYIEMTAPKR